MKLDSNKMKHYIKGAMFVLIILAVFEMQNYLDASKKVFYSNMSNGMLMHDVTGNNPYIEIELKKSTVLSDVRIKIHGINETGIENYIYWRDEGENYDDAKSLLYSYQNNGESYDIQIERDYFRVKYIKIVPNDPIKRIGRISVRTLSERHEECIELIVVLLLCIALCLFVSGKVCNYIIGLLEKKPLLFYSITLASVICIVFFRYLFNGHYFIFRDVAIDSYIHTLPNYINQIIHINSSELGSGWNQYVGLGMEQKTYFPTLQNWFLLLGKGPLYYLIGLNASIKVMISGICAYLYAGMFTKNNTIRWTVGFGYAFSGMMIIRSPWETYGTIVALSMFWLLMFEYTLREEKYIYYIIGTVSFFVCMKAYDVILFIIVFGSYIIFRIGGVKVCVKKLIKLEMIFLVVALGSAMDVLLYQIPQILDSRRYNNNPELGVLVSWKELVSGFCRTVGMDIQGVTKKYSTIGWWNFLEDPTFYCGLLIFISLPSCFASMLKRSKWRTIVPFLMVFAYILFVPVRYMMNGRAGMTWKLSSLWVAFVMIYFFANKGEKLFKIDRTTLVLLNITSIGVTVSLFLIYINSLYANYMSLVLSFSFTIVYTLLYDAHYFGMLPQGSFSKCIIIFVTCEALIFSKGVLNNRCVITNREVQNGHGYFDDTIMAVDRLSNAEIKQPYRIDKQFFSVSNCDSLVQQYMDVEAYVGGEGIGRSIYDIEDYYNLPNGLEYRILDGSSTNNYFNTMIATKYIFSRNPDIANYGYSSIDKIGDIYIFENNYSLPFVYACENYYNFSSFEKLSPFERSRGSIGGCFVLDEEATDYVNRTNVGMTKINYFQEGDKYYPNEYKGVGLRFDVIFENPGPDREGVLNYVGHSGEPNYYYIQVPKGQSQSSFEIAQQSISSFWLDSSTSQFISNVIIYDLSEEYFSDYREEVKERNKHALLISYSDQNNIRGTIKCDKEEYLFVAIPYNSKWRIDVDGVRQNVISVNGGFLGTKIQSGEHQVKIWFETKSWVMSNIFKIVTILLVALYLFAKIYFRKKQKVLSASIGV